MVSRLSACLEWLAGLGPAEGLLEAGTELDFTLTFRGTVAATTEDQIFVLTLNVLGDGTTLLDSKDIVVLVPGTSY